jgi:uncharacterized membrane protein
MHKKEPFIHAHELHPVFRQKLTIGQKTADAITKFGGSWIFILVFGVILLSWVGINSWFFLMDKPFDPYPFILLNLVLSCLAAVQAPIILMSQNREGERDRIYAYYDYQVNRKAEREIEELQEEMQEIKKLLKR